MAKKTGLGQQCYVHGYDLSGDVGSIASISSPRAVHDITGIDKSAVERLLGLGSGELSFSTFFNDAALQEHAALAGRVTTNRLVTIQNGTAAGDVAWMLQGKQINYDWMRDASGALLGTVQVLSDAVAREDGVVLISLNTLSSTGQTAVLDNGAASASGMAGVLHIFDINSGTPTVIIQESSDSGSGDAWATIKAFAAVANGNEPASERVTVAGGIERYLRISVTGTFSNCKYAVAVRRGESTDDTAYA